MDDLRDRFVAYGTRPDIYDAPTPLQCVTIASEVKRLREALELADAALSGANMNMKVVERKARDALAKFNGA